ncbi:hypothetical protein [Mangrovibacterium marinum]|uniref:Uncharacterized protein n=1 Tax=Mangrovibacterium marinum TaxID=1639118 RepID=A0A2T5BZ41_9BACT|nr:hypothetical protein [Mangrovibacterium marinum]PTN07519.1 hypothetical protein C8N47_11644 [Mangrovibacterium marinum]
MNQQDEQFRKLMQNYRPQRAPVDFSKRVMDQIHALPKLEYKPVFGKWFLTIFLSVFAGFVAVVLFMSGSARPATEAPGLLDKVPQVELEVFNEAHKEVLGWLAQLPSVLIFALMVVAVLLVFDHLLNRRMHQRKL